MVAPLLLAAAGIGAVKSLVGGITGNSAARARGRALDAAARQARAESGVAAQMGMEDDARMMARAETMAAAGGGGFGGSTLNVLDDLARQSVFKARSTIYRAEREASNSEYEAKVSRRDGRNAMIGGVLSAAGSALTAFLPAPIATASLLGGAAGAATGKATNSSNSRR